MPDTNKNSDTKTEKLSLNTATENVDNNLGASGENISLSRQNSFNTVEGEETVIQNEQPDSITSFTSVSSFSLEETNKRLDNLSLSLRNTKEDIQKLQQDFTSFADKTKVIISQLGHLQKDFTSFADKTNIIISQLGNNVSQNNEHFTELASDFIEINNSFINLAQSQENSEKNITILKQQTFELLNNVCDLKSSITKLEEFVTKQNIEKVNTDEILRTVNNIENILQARLRNFEQTINAKVCSNKAGITFFNGSLQTKIQTLKQKVEKDIINFQEKLDTISQHCLDTIYTADTHIIQHNKNQLDYLKQNIEKRIENLTTKIRQYLNIDITNKEQEQNLNTLQYRDRSKLRKEITDLNIQTRQTLSEKLKKISFSIKNKNNKPEQKSVQKQPSQKRKSVFIKNFFTFLKENFYVYIIAPLFFAKKILLSKYSLTVLFGVLTCYFINFFL